MLAFSFQELFGWMFASFRIPLEKTAQKALALNPLQVYTIVELQEHARVTILLVGGGEFMSVMSGSGWVSLCQIQVTPPKDLPFHDF